MRKKIRQMAQRGSTDPLTSRVFQQPAKPFADSDSYANTHHALTQQFNPVTPYEEHLVTRLAHEFWSLEQMGTISREALTRLTSITPTPLAIAQRIDFPWPSQAHRLQEASDPLALQRRLRKSLLRLIGPGAPSALSPQVGALLTPVALKSLRKALELLHSTDALKVIDSEPLWQSIDHLVHRLDEANRQGFSSDQGYSPLLTPRGPGTVPRRRRQPLLTNAAEDATPKFEVSTQSSATPTPLGGSHNHASPYELADALTTYWLYRHQHDISQLGLLMVAEQRMAMLCDPGAIRAQDAKLKNIARLEQMLFESKSGIQQRLLNSGVDITYSPVIGSVERL
jgi:hypothetical protein